MTSRHVCAALAVVLLLTAVAQARLAGVDAPGAPLTLAAAVDGHTVTLSWRPPLEGGAPAYAIEASLQPGGAPIYRAVVRDTSLVAASVPDGVYYVRVRAAIAEALGPPSNEVQIQVPGPVQAGCTQVPLPPVNVLVEVSGHGVRLTWGPPVGGCPSTSFAVQAGSAPGSSDIAVIDVGGQQSLIANAPSGYYYIRVLARNRNGESLPSREVLANVDVTCPRPSVGPEPFDTSGRDRVWTLTWAPVPGATAYRVESAESSTQPIQLETTATTCTLVNIPTGLTLLRVRALNACGQGPLSQYGTVFANSSAPFVFGSGTCGVRD